MRRKDRSKKILKEGEYQRNNGTYEYNGEIEKGIDILYMLKHLKN